MVLITLLRHAPLPLEYQKCFIGHCDIKIDLSLTNIKKLENIKKREYKYVYSSDLIRCTQTLDLLGLKYEKDERLREVKFKKEFERKSFNEIENFDSYDSKYLSSMKSWHEYICEETLVSFENRIKSFLQKIPKDGDILICSHAGTIRIINSILEKEDYEKSLFKINYLESVDYII